MRAMRRRSIGLFTTRRDACPRLDDMRRAAHASSRWAHGLFHHAARHTICPTHLQNLAIDEFATFQYNGGTPTVVGLLYTVSFAPLYTTVAGYLSTLDRVPPRDA